jgi:predicted GH43/DUF377 family glycosyl hydrolase
MNNPTLFVRHPLNPLITPRDVRPSREDFEVIGAFNAGATTFHGETLLLLRVAERPISHDPAWILCPFLSQQGELSLLRVRRDDPGYDTSDPRLIRERGTSAIYLTSMSHLRLARSTDGLHFTVADQPWLAAQTVYEGFGVEDARITCIDGAYYVNYTAVSPHGIATALVKTTDFISIERLGVMFPPSNRDVTLFPERINGLYGCYHRPMPGDFGKLSIWFATSPDLIHWGGHQLVLEGSVTSWDGGRVGGGAPPVWTDAGWLSIYHAADSQNRYCLGAFLTSHDQPGRVLFRSPIPIFEPLADYETGGFFPNVVFTCGMILQGDKLRLYYGASDDSIALAEASLNFFIEHLQGQQ